MAPRILVLALGGTIAMTRTASGGIAPSLTAADLVAAVPGLGDIAMIEARSPFQLPGASLTLGHLSAVAAIIREAAVQGIAGVVVVQGTDTIEETAFVLDRLVPAVVPVVVTGAMRGADAPGADGPANLAAAVTVAAATAAQGLGTMVVLNDTAHAAALVRKGHTGLPSAFTSAPFGPVGHVIEGRFVPVLTPAPAPRLPPPPEGEAPPVALLQIGLGDDGRLLPALPELGFRGLVVAAMGAGHVPERLVEALAALAARMPVVLCSRVTEGPVFVRTYAFAGSERDLRARGLLGSGALGPLKARLLLQLALAAGYSPDRITELFAMEEGLA
jgi:L-asparaginase